MSEFQRDRFNINFPFTYVHLLFLFFLSTWNNFFLSVSFFFVFVPFWWIFLFLAVDDIKTVFIVLITSKNENKIEKNEECLSVIWRLFSSVHIWRWSEEEMSIDDLTCWLVVNCDVDSDKFNIIDYISASRKNG